MDIVCRSFKGDELHRPRYQNPRTVVPAVFRVHAGWRNPAREDGWYHGFSCAVVRHGSVLPRGLHRSKYGVNIMTQTIQPAPGQVHHISARFNIGGPPSVGRTPEEIGFTRLLIEIICASPDRRTKPKQELVELGMTRFGLSKRRAIALRERAIDVSGARAWSRAGAPRHPRS